MDESLTFRRIQQHNEILLIAKLKQELDTIRISHKDGWVEVHNDVKDRL